MSTASNAFIDLSHLLVLDWAKVVEAKEIINSPAVSNEALCKRLLSNCSMVAQPIVLYSVCFESRLIGWVLASNYGQLSQDSPDAGSFG